MTGASAAIVAVALLLGGGVLPAVAAVGVDLRALALAPVCTALCGALAGWVAVVTTTATWPWMAAAVIAANCIAVGRLRTTPRGRTTPGATAAGAVVFAASALPLFGLRVPNVAWDARSIWFLHARWFFAGGGYARWAMRDAAYLFSHPDYPPLVPGTVGSLWHAIGGINLHAGQVVVTTLNVAALALVGTAFIRASATRAVGAVVGAAISVAALAVAGKFVANSYVDLLWAGLAVAAALHLLVLPPDSGDLAVGVLSAAGAALTKNDGIPIAALVLLLAAVRHRRRLLTTRPAAAVAAGVVVVGAWTLAASSVHAHSDLFTGGHGTGAPLATTHHPLARADRAARALWGVIGADARLAVLVAVVGALGLVAARRRLRLGSSAWMWVAIAGSVAAVVGAYAVSPYDLGWHLLTSLPRTSMAPRLLLLSEVGVWVVCGIEAVVAAWRRRAPTSSMDQASVVAASP